MFTSVKKSKCESHTSDTLALLSILAKTVILSKVLLQNSFPRRWVIVLKCSGFNNSSFPIAWGKLDELKCFLDFKIPTPLHGGAHTHASYCCSSVSKRRQPSLMTRQQQILTGNPSWMVLINPMAFFPYISIILCVRNCSWLHEERNSVFVGF